MGSAARNDLQLSSERIGPGNYLNAIEYSDHKLRPQYREGSLVLTPPHRINLVSQAVAPVHRSK